MRASERNRNRAGASAYMAKAGGNMNDKKTQAAYDRFKTPPWYLKDKKKEEEKKSE